MMEYIRDAGLTPARPYLRRKKTELVVLHHVQGSMSVRAVHNMHLKRGHRGIDYNIYIDTDGSVYWGRGLTYEGGHTLNSGKSAGVNARSVGIVCNGDFTRYSMPFLQHEALVRTVCDVARMYGLGADAVRAHREVGNTDCPGRFFPLEDVRRAVRALHEPKPPTYTSLSAKPVEGMPGVLDMAAEGVRASQGVARVEFLAYPKALGRGAQHTIPAKPVGSAGRWAKRYNAFAAWGKFGGRVIVRCRVVDAQGNASQDSSYRELYM